MIKTETNHWHDDECAVAFWDQYQAVPYQELLRHTIEMTDPQPGQQWLDLGCGAGHLAAALWKKSQGEVDRIVAMDCAAINARPLAKLRRRLQPQPTEEQLAFVQGDFSHGLPQLDDESFDGVVSGLSLSYAEHWDETKRAHTNEGYLRVLSEIYRILKPGAALVYSVNVPHPRFWKIAWKSLWKAPVMSKPGRVLISALKMQSYGRWLKREARKGRFHFLPIEEIIQCLNTIGYTDITHRLSYAKQAYVIRAVKPDENYPPLTDLWL